MYLIYYFILRRFESYLVMCFESLEYKFSFFSVEEDELNQSTERHYGTVDTKMENNKNKMWQVLQ